MNTENISFKGYFDWAATTPLNTEILNNAIQKVSNCYANPSSVHAMGIDAKKLLTQAREKCAKALNVKPENLIFTSGGTESDYLPMLSLLQRQSARQSENRGTIIISAIEHPAIREQAEMMKNCGFSVISVAPEKNGIISVEKLISKVDLETVLVCVMGVNNETGCIQPVYEIADALTEKTKGHKRPKFHVDAVQTIGKIPFYLGYKGIDSAAISAHKLRGPRGIGLLYMAQRQEPFIRGGNQENGLRPGTENLLGALALADCLEDYALTPKNQITAKEISKTFTEKDTKEKLIEFSSKSFERMIEQTELTNDFIKEISSIEGASIIPKERTDSNKQNLFSPWVLQMSFAKIPGEVMVRALSEKGFYISTGSACSAKKMSRPVLEVMGISKEEATNAVRFSFGHETQKQDIKDLIIAIKEITNLFK